MNNVTVSEVPADAQIIDVREPSEYAQGHAQGAINIPLGSMVAGQRDPGVGDHRDQQRRCSRQAKGPQADLQEIPDVKRCILI